MNQAKLKFADELGNAFNSVYQAIGFDLGGFEDSNHSITREDLFSICLDHLDSYGDMTPEVKAYWDSIDFKTMMTYQDVVFKYENYEVGGA